MLSSIRTRWDGGARKVGWPGVAGLIAATWLAQLAGAQEKPKPTYDVTVWAIRATKSNSEISPELKPIAAELKERFKYTGFKLERKHAARGVEEGKEVAASLIAGFQAKITPTKREGERVTLRIEVAKTEGKKEKPLMRTAVTINRGRFQLQGGWKIEPKSDDVLIVAVSAR